MQSSSISELRRERVEELAREGVSRRPKVPCGWRFGAEATEEDLKNLTEMLEEILSDDKLVCRRGIVDLVEQMDVNGKSADIVKPLMQPVHIERLVFLLGESEWADYALRVLMRVVDPVFVPKLIECGGIEKFRVLLNDVNPDVAWRCVLVIGNCLIVDSGLFRNEAFSAGLLESVAVTESLVDREKDRLWCLKNSLRVLPFPDGLSEMITHHVLEIWDSSRSDCTSAALKILEIIVKESVSHEYRTEIYEMKMIQRLGDAIILEKTPTAVRALAVIADCCLRGDDMLEQMIFFDVPVKVRDAFMKLGIVDEMVYEMLSFLENWLNSSEIHIGDLMRLFGYANFFEKLLSGSSIVTKMYAVRVLERFVVVTRDVTQLKELISPSMLVTLTDIAPNDTDLAKFYVFPVIRQILAAPDSELILGAANILAPFIDTPDYDQFRTSEDKELADQAQLVESRVQAILNEASP